MKAPWKQALSLALCGAVLTGALALGAGAADAGSFTDAKSVTHWQAVATLAKLDVISGKEDGSFDQYVVNAVDLASGEIYEGTLDAAEAPAA